MARDTKVMERELRELFEKEYGGSPDFFIVSPGRVNIIGEHTDYNNGFVLPMAIDRCLMMAVKKRSDDLVRVVTTDFTETVEFSIGDLEKGRFTWGEYISGSMWVLREAGSRPVGFDMVITGNIPVGASLSSSAALELGVLRAAAHCSGYDWQPFEMAKLAQRAENEWVGMNCGLMDQAICACGKEGHAILIDFQDMVLTPRSIPEGSSIVVLDTTTRRGLIDSAYNERRQQCDNAAAVMGVATLREADAALLEKYRDQMAPVDYIRARHVILENDRVLRAAEAMAANDNTRLGELMYESHCSLRDDFDVSSTALNAMVECAMTHEACYGARMTGAGFAGCAVALVRKGDEDDFVAQVAAEYEKQMQMKPGIYVCAASDGTSITAA